MCARGILRRYDRRGTATAPKPPSLEAPALPATSHTPSPKKRYAPKIILVKRNRNIEEARQRRAKKMVGKAEGFCGDGVPDVLNR